MEDLVNVPVLADHQVDLARLTLEVDGVGLGVKIEEIKLIFLNFTFYSSSDIPDSSVSSLGSFFISLIFNEYLNVQSQSKKWDLKNP